MLDIIGASAVGSPIVKAKSVELKRRDFTPTFTCQQMQKDLELILGAGKELGVPMPVTAVVAQLMQACIGSGDADDDYIATVKLIERLSGLDTRHVA
jgi:3-hydroxyisobutyrate dehydrogenase